jgi:hypothetical protein
VIQRLLQNPIAAALLEGRFEAGDTVVVDRQHDDLTIIRADPSPLAQSA